MIDLLTALLVALQAQAATPPAVEAPLEFRCDNMQVKTKPNRTYCRQNVVLRRGNLIVCCHLFEGFADDEWGWQRFVCTQQVRAQRVGETMWADKAEFILETSDLILTGRPRLRRGKSILEGTRVVVDVKSDRARIEQPRGQMRAADDGAKPARSIPLEGPLPDKCPVPPPPRG